MNKHVVIVIIASIIIASPIVFSGWNIFAAEQLQFSRAEERFNYFDIINDGKISVCNPLPFYLNFNRINIVMIFDEKSKGSFGIPGTTLPPVSSSVLEGVFKSQTFEEAQYLSLHFDGMFGSSAPVRIDPSRFFIITEIQTPIIGVIPYSVTKQYSGLDFWNIMNEKNDVFSC